MLRVLDLFSGIGGFSLGLERTGGFKTVAFCEIEEFPRKVLKKHWPTIPIYPDVTKLSAKQLTTDGISVDVICGGFPCQDISFAGKGAGIKGERSGLWEEYSRLIGELRPQYVIVENVSALLSRGLSDVLGDLATLGYDAEWHCIPAAAVGAPHRRDRAWVISYPCGVRRLQCKSLEKGQQYFGRGKAWSQPNPLRPDVAHTTSKGANGHAKRAQPPYAMLRDSSEDVGNPNLCGLQGIREGWQQIVEARHIQWQSEGPSHGAWKHWSTEPNVGRVAHGIPARVDRLKGLGNAVVPQIVEMIGNAILDI